MIEDLARALNRRQWPEYVHQQLGPMVGDAVAPFLSPVVGAGMDSADGPLPIGVSKVGGLPHVDGSFRWPVETGTDEPLALVCQVNLDDVRRTGVSGGEKLRGMLYLFAIFDSDRAYGYEIDETTAKLVHVPQTGPLTVAPRPAGLPDEGVFEERPLRVSWSLLADERGESKRFDYEVEKAIDDELAALGGVPCDVIRLLGAPHPWREETQEIVDELEAPRLLLYVNGYAVQRYAFGEGDFRLVLEKADLDAGRIDKAEILFEPGT